MRKFTKILLITVIFLLPYENEYFESIIFHKKMLPVKQTLSDVLFRY